MEAPGEAAEVVQVAAKTAVAGQMVAVATVVATMARVAGDSEAVAMEGARVVVEAKDKVW